MNEFISDYWVFWAGSLIIIIGAIVLIRFQRGAWKKVFSEFAESHVFKINKEKVSLDEDLQYLNESVQVGGYTPVLSAIKGEYDRKNFRLYYTNYGILCAIKSNSTQNKRIIIVNQKEKLNWKMFVKSGVITFVRGMKKIEGFLPEFNEKYKVYARNNVRSIINEEVQKTIINYDSSIPIVIDISQGVITIRTKRLQTMSEINTVFELSFQIVNAFEKNK
ncbi:hypothetical protein KKG83_06310 [Candidatus Micrarchaeota archaeon]|nr:hypothetical protein [Candidatus Micrarchaeota archaeon]